MKNSSISWTDHTFNPWWGCTKLSEACDNCYVEPWAKRCGFKLFGSNSNRRMFSDAHWQDPIRWDKDAAHSLTPVRVFCGSMCDVMEDHSKIGAERNRLFDLIERTENLQWLLLTKRPKNLARFLPASWLKNPSPNVCLGVTAENQARANERIPLLLQTPAAVRFVSCEPLLGPIDLRSALGGTRWIGGRRGCGSMHHGIGSPDCPRELHHHHDDRCKKGIDWVICGGESGPGARPMHPDWVRSLRGQCVDVRVPFHFKSWGEWIPGAGNGFTQWPDIDKKRPLLMPAHPGRPGFDDHHIMLHAGKKNSSRMLDGREWLEFPEVANERTTDTF